MAIHIRRGDRHHRILAYCKTMVNTPKTITIPDRSRPGLPTAASSIGTHQGRSLEKWTTGEKAPLKLAKQQVTIDTWKVRTLYAEGKIPELEYEMERCQWDILGIAEMRWLNTGEAVTDNGHKI